jgi:hypothetical protein
MAGFAAASCISRDQEVKANDALVRSVAAERMQSATVDGLGSPVVVLGCAPDARVADRFTYGCVRMPPAASKPQRLGSSCMNRSACGTEII